ncbi:MAG: zinc ribbon domain-containing protein [Thermoplasmata archaeon]
MVEKVCPRCNASIPKGAEKCPECKKNLERRELDVDERRKVEETLDMVDGETYEIKSEESDALIENIKKIGASNYSSRDEDVTSEEKEIIVYECPVCGANVSEDDEKCHNCGAIFEE